MKNGTITTKASKIKAIIKLFFASFEVLELLSNIMSIMPANTKNNINVVKPDVKSSRSTGNLINAYIKTMINAIP